MSGTDEQAGELIEAVEGDKGKTVDAPDKKADDTPKFTQADVDRLIKDRLDRAEKVAREKADKATKEAEEQSLAKNAEWKTLAEKREKELADLMPYKERAERYETVLKKQLEQVRKGLRPTDLKLLDRLDPAEQLEFIADNAEELMPAKATPNGVGSNPAGSTGKGLTTEEQQKRSAGMRRAWRGM